MPAGGRPLNARLMWQRLQRGWSREELVEQIRRSIAEHADGRCGLKAEVVRRWENGEACPEPRYRKHLVLVFGLSASELGLLTADELALRPEEHGEPVTGRGVIGEGAVDAVVRAVMLVLGGGTEHGRDRFLGGLLATSLAPILSFGMETPADADAILGEHNGRLDAHAVDAYCYVTASHRALYWASPGYELLPSVAAHAQLGERMLRPAHGAEEIVRRLAAAVAESALLVARVAFFDLGRIDVADHAFQLAQDAVDVSEDHALTAAVLAHRAFVPGFAGQPERATELLRAARAHARYAAGALLRSWLHCVDAEISARTGQGEVSLSRISAAEDALSTDGVDPQWLDFFDGSRLAGFAGNALLLAGNHRAAALRLHQALNGLSVDASKQRAVVLLDLAHAQASTDAEQALNTARQACDLLDHMGYVTALQRLPAVRTALSATPYGAELEDRVKGISSMS